MTIQCPHCGGTHIVKYGISGNRQRYQCRDCQRTFTETSRTLMSAAKIKPEQAVELIECEIEGLSLKETSYRTDLSGTTCFNFRQRLYSLASARMENIQLQGQIEVDSTYTKINLAGTHPDKMPRKSKKRGKKKPVVGELKSLRGLSHHKICIVTAIDEKDNILYRVAGLGPETIDKYSQYAKHFAAGKTVVCDSDSSISSFAIQHGMNTDVIPRNHYTTANGNSLGDINQLHQTLKDMIRIKHGVSTRHLPGYLNWICYLKQKIYTYDREDLAAAILKDLYESKTDFLRDNICTAELPISLYEAYGEYHYGIFSD